MDWNELFVALSRASLAENIGICYNSEKVYVRASPPTGEQVKVAPVLFTGYIYDRTDGTNHYIGSTVNFEKRRAEHEAKPVSQKVAAWEETTKEIKMSVLEKFICSSEKQLVRREYYHIGRMPADVCMNTNGVCKAAVEKTTTTIAAVTVDYTRFKITDDEKQDRFRIQWRELGAAQEKTFSYKVKSKANNSWRLRSSVHRLVKKFFA